MHVAEDTGEDAEGAEKHSSGHTRLDPPSHLQTEHLSGKQSLVVLIRTRQLKLGNE